MIQRLPKSTAETVLQLEKDVEADSSTQVAFRKLRSELEADGWWDRDLVHEGKLIGIWAGLVIGAFTTAHSIPLLSIGLTSLAMTQAGWLGHDYNHGVDDFSQKMRSIVAFGGGLGSTWWSDKHNKHHALSK